jgi:hypothetical protein
MVAPGMNYQYFEGPSFKSRTKDLPELAAAVEAHVRRHFDRLEMLDPDTRVGEVAFQGQRFGYAVLRIGAARLVLQQIWNADEEMLDAAALEAAQQKLRRKK